ncbi:hypothetical protein QBC43DRAFT_72336 [Cladorrhinum sp. PSN259]|nr:hypothetical protein QBC43DRAFT_72336 [Cladorrhinum sp. PSN259]
MRDKDNPLHHFPSLGPPHFYLMFFCPLFFFLLQTPESIHGGQTIPCFQHHTYHYYFCSFLFLFFFILEGEREGKGGGRRNVFGRKNGKDLTGTDLNGLDLDGNGREDLLFSLIVLCLSSRFPGVFLYITPRVLIYLSLIALKKF